MKQSEYNRMTEKEFKGRVVRSLVVLQNGMFKIPAGTLFTITGKQGGLHLTSESCKYCGVMLFISRVQPYQVELL